jgi:hypothetical protein
MRWVEAASVGILALYLYLQHRRGQLAPFAREAAWIALAGYLAEDLCIRLFAFYDYSPGWLLIVDRMPALVALIWPFVILSARDVARALRPHRSPVLMATGIVLFDAALIEPVAVRSGLWTWSEYGLWEVPLIGVWGWGVFAAIALALLERGRAWLVTLVAPPLANLLLVASWWGFFRWGVREELSLAVKVAASALVSLALVMMLRKERGMVELHVMIPRAVAASLFFAMVFVHGDAALWAYVVPFGLPYLWIMRLGRAPAPAGAVLG